jgi:hypothetical protein
MNVTYFRILVVGEEGKLFSLQPATFSEEGGIESVGVYIPRGGKGERFDHEATEEEKEAVLLALTDVLRRGKIKKVK